MVLPPELRWTGRDGVAGGVALRKSQCAVGGGCSWWRGLTVGWCWASLWWFIAGVVMCLSIAIRRPDHVLARGTHVGFQWVVTHNGDGYRCGYVQVPAGHPWHGIEEYSALDGVDVHGGVTFLEADVPCDAAGADDAWWVGFDCAHGGDAQDPALPRTGSVLHDPVMLALDLLLKRVVRSQKYVEGQCIALCEQAQAAIWND